MARATRLLLRGVLLWVSACQAFHPYVLPSQRLPTGRPGYGRHSTVSMSSTWRGRSRINYYEVLGIPPDATRDAIKRAYHQKAKTLHPDLSRTVNTTGDFLLVKEAYETLHDLEMRLDFDRKKAVGEVAELAVNVGEILAADLAIPLARDVALPLIKATFNHIDQTLIKQLRPIASSVMEQSNKMYQAFKEDAERRAAYQRAEQATRELEHRRALKMLLVETSDKLRKAQEATDRAHAALEHLIKTEQRMRERVNEEKSTGRELILQYAEISEEIRLATNTYNAAVSHEESVAKDYDSLSGEARTASDQVHEGDESVSAAHTELQEAEEALRQTQIRVQNAKESFSSALSELAERKLKKSATDTKLEAGSLILTAAKLAVKAHRNELDTVRTKEEELKKLSERHAEVQRELLRELADSSRGRQMAQKEVERAEKTVAQLQERMTRLSERLERAEQRAGVARDFVGSSSGPTNDKPVPPYSAPTPNDSKPVPPYSATDDKPVASSNSGLNDEKPLPQAQAADKPPQPITPPTPPTPFSPSGPTLYTPEPFTPPPAEPLVAPPLTSEGPTNAGAGKGPMEPLGEQAGRSAMGMGEQAQQPISRPPAAAPSVHSMAPLSMESRATPFSFLW